MIRKYARNLFMQLELEVDELPASRHSHERDRRHARDGKEEPRFQRIEREITRTTVAYAKEEHRGEAESKSHRTICGTELHQGCLEPSRKQHIHVFHKAGEVTRPKKYPSKNDGDVDADNRYNPPPDSIIPYSKELAFQDVQCLEQRMQRTPRDKCPGCAMPKTAQQEDNPDIPYCLRKTASTSAQWNIHIILEPRGK